MRPSTPSSSEALPDRSPSRGAARAAASERIAGGRRWRRATSAQRSFQVKTRGRSGAARGALRSETSCSRARGVGTIQRPPSTWPNSSTARPRRSAAYGRARGGDVASSWVGLPHGVPIPWDPLRGPSSCRGPRRKTIRAAGPRGSGGLIGPGQAPRGRGRIGIQKITTKPPLGQGGPPDDRPVTDQSGDDGGQEGRPEERRGKHRRLDVLQLQHARPAMTGTAMSQAEADGPVALESAGQRVVIVSALRLTPARGRGLGQADQEASSSSARLKGGRQAPADILARDALLIGLAQAFAPLPGVSRSALTITTALARGFPARLWAVGFSLLMAVPYRGGACGAEGRQAVDACPGVLGPTLLATVVAGLVVTGRSSGWSALSERGLCGIFLYTYSSSASWCLPCPMRPPDPLGPAARIVFRPKALDTKMVREEDPTGWELHEGGRPMTTPRRLLWLGPYAADSRPGRRGIRPRRGRPLDRPTPSRVNNSSRS